jgi:beta-lactamase superfamily II metal-dependent hydrolase
MTQYAHVQNSLKQLSVCATLLVLISCSSHDEVINNRPLPATAETVSAHAPDPKNTSQIEIRFLDVGEGDATLITTPNRRHVLVDAGPRASQVGEYLLHQGINTLSLVVASHNHSDHIGGLLGVFQSVVVSNYLQNDLPAPSAIYSRVLAAAEASSARVLRFEERTFMIDGIALRVLPPVCSDRQQNDCSIGLEVRYGKFAALLTGDSERASLDAWIKSGKIGRASLVKVAHHGSPDGTTEEWVRLTHPAIAVISVGRKNGYRLPSADVIALWEQGGATVYRTDVNGTVTVRSNDSDDIQVFVDR